MSLLFFSLIGLVALTQARSAYRHYGYEFAYHPASAPCDTVVCRVGFRCEENDEGKAQCMKKPGAESTAATPCANFPCAGGTRCVVDEMFAPRCVETDKAGECPSNGSEAVECTQANVKLQVYFLADLTGSSSDVLDAIRSDVTRLTADIVTSIPHTKFAVGYYRDFGHGHQPMYKAFATQQDFGSATDAHAAIGASWSASYSGGDRAEAQLYALTQIAQQSRVSWLDDHVHVIVWLGDAPGHDPICPAIVSGSSLTTATSITEATTTAALLANNIVLVAISTNAGPDAGLDQDPTRAAFDYAGVCEPIGGSAGQATRMTSATGGFHLVSSGTDIVSLMSMAVLNATMAADCPPSTNASCYRYCSDDADCGVGDEKCCNDILCGADGKTGRACVIPRM